MGGQERDGWLRRRMGGALRTISGKDRDGRQREGYMAKRGMGEEGWVAKYRMGG